MRLGLGQGVDLERGEDRRFSRHLLVWLTEKCDTFQRAQALFFLCGQILALYGRCLAEADRVSGPRCTTLEVSEVCLTARLEMLLHSLNALSTLPRLISPVEQQADAWKRTGAALSSGARTLPCGVAGNPAGI